MRSLPTLAPAIRPEPRPPRACRLAPRAISFDLPISGDNKIIISTRVGHDESEQYVSWALPKVIIRTPRSTWTLLAVVLACLGLASCGTARAFSAATTSSTTTALTPTTATLNAGGISKVPVTMGPIATPGSTVNPNDYEFNQVIASPDGKLFVSMARRPHLLCRDSHLGGELRTLSARQRQTQPYAGVNALRKLSQNALEK